MTAPNNRAYETLHFAARTTSGIVFVNPNHAIQAEHVVAVLIEMGAIVFIDVNGIKHRYEPPSMANKPNNSDTVAEYYAEAISFWMQALEARAPKP